MSVSDDSNFWPSADESDGDVDEASGRRAGVPIVEQPEDAPNAFAAESFNELFDLEDAEDSAADVREAASDFLSIEEREEESAAVDEKEAAAPLPPAERPAPPERMGVRVDKIHRLLARHPHLAAEFAERTGALLSKTAVSCE
ncbi:hypothetical protein M3Y99_00737800 [Aphelenchoides fujianensis]|nr:hypothetical protein M3Y99_00737800 [Aphelenchoides fujianensis]